MDSSKKLVTHKGVTTTQGWVDGSMTFDDTTQYLARLGILGFYEDTLLKAIVVPEGKQAYYRPSGKTYTPGKLIAGVRERSWEEFEAALSGTPRGEDWELSDTGEGMPEDTPRLRTDSGEKDWDAWNMAVNQIAMHYDEDTLEDIFYNLLEGANQIEDEAERNNQVEQIYNLVEEVHEAKVKKAKENLSLAASEAGMGFQEQQDTTKMIEDFAADLELKKNPLSGNLNLTLGRGDLHFGALVAMMTISHNREGLDKISELMDNSLAGNPTGRIEMTDKEFFGHEDVSPELYRDVLLALRKNMSNEERIMSLLQVSDKLVEARGDYNKENFDTELQEVKARVDRISQSIEELHQQLDSYDRVDAEVISALSDYNTLRGVAEIHQGLSSGNFMTQTVLDYAKELLGDEHHPKVLELLDKSFNYSLGDKNQNLQDFVKENGREALRDALLSSPVQALTPDQYKVTEPDLGNEEDGDSSPASIALSSIVNSVRRTFIEAFSDKELDERRSHAAEIGPVEIPPELRELVMPKALEDFLGANSHDGAVFPSVYEQFGVTDKKAFQDKFAVLLANHIRQKVDSKDKQYLMSLRTASRYKAFEAVLKELGGETSVTVMQGGVQKQDNMAKIMASAVPNNNAGLKLGAIHTDPRWSHLVNSIKTLSNPPKPVVPTVPTSVGWSNPTLREAIEGIASVVAYQAHSKWDLWKEQNIDVDVHQRSARALLFFTGTSDAKVNPNTGSFLSGDGSSYMHARILSLARFLPPETSSGYEWNKASIGWMDEVITQRAVREGWSTPGADRYMPTQHDYLSLFSSYTGERRPSELLMNNVLAGISHTGVLSENDVAEMARQTTFKTEERNLTYLDRSTREFFGFEGTLTDNGKYKLSNGNYDGLSLTGLFGALRHQPDGREKMSAEVGKRTKGMNPQVAEYAQNLLTDDMFRNRGKIGHAFEKMAMVPLINDAMEEFGATEFEVLTPQGKYDLNALDGVKFQDTKGNIHFMGKINGASNGALDTTHLIIDGDGHVTIRGYEIKMEERSPAALPPIGNVTHHARMLAHLKRDGATHSLFRDKEGNQRGFSGATYEDNTLISASQHAPTSQTNELLSYAANYRSDLRSVGNRYIAAGQVANVGSITMADGRKIAKPFTGVK